MGRNARRILVVVTLGITMAFAGGCGYLQNRGSDALDIIDAGVTVSPQPQFSLYSGFLNVLSLGYSNMDGTFYGLSEGRGGKAVARQNAGGLLLYGVEQLGYRDVNFENPASPEPWKVGIIGLAEGPGPRNGQVVNCPKLLHLGWVGLTLNCKFGELADFLLGWTTADIMGDDGG